MGKYHEVVLEVVQSEEGAEKIKTAKELNLVDAQSITEAEARVHSYMPSSVTFKAISTKPSKIVDVLEGNGDGVYYDVTLDIVTSAPEETKVRTTKEQYLLRATGISDAESKMREHYRESLMDYSVTSIKLSRIVDVISADD